MPATRTIICKQCRKTVSIDNIRYDKAGNDLICIPCYNGGPAQPQQKPGDARERFMCLRCNYKFSIRKDSRLTRKCPYCASPNITVPQTLTAENVLEEVATKSEVTFLKR